MKMIYLKYAIINIIIKNTKNNTIFLKSITYIIHIIQYYVIQYITYILNKPIYLLIIINL